METGPFASEFYTDGEKNYGKWQLQETSWNFLRKPWGCCKYANSLLLGASKNEYLRILGGEYSALDLYIRKLITDLRSLDISLVMFIDGAKGILEIHSFGLIRTSIRICTVDLWYNPDLTAREIQVLWIQSYWRSMSIWQCQCKHNLLYFLALLWHRRSVIVSLVDTERNECKRWTI